MTTPHLYTNGIDIVRATSPEEAEQILDVWIEDTAGEPQPPRKRKFEAMPDDQEVAIWADDDPKATPEIRNAGHWASRITESQFVASADLHMDEPR